MILIVPTGIYLISRRAVKKKMTEDNCMISYTDDDDYAQPWLRTSVVFCCFYYRLNLLYIISGIRYI